MDEALTRSVRRRPLAGARTLGLVLARLSTSVVVDERSRHAVPTTGGDRVEVIEVEVRRQ